MQPQAGGLHFIGMEPATSGSHTRNRARSPGARMACSHIPTCPLFKHFQSNATLRSWKLMYCDSDKRSQNCERFKRSEAGETVPPNMLPNGKSILL
jgi:hypothetical protein